MATKIKPPALPAAAETPSIKSPFTDSSGSYSVPVWDNGLTFTEVGSTGLRQFSGWIREEFLLQLQGRQAARVYREMLDNSPDVGGAMLAITGAMRKVAWRTDPADDTPEAQEMADFAESLRFDMSGTWEDFVTEALSMLTYGFAPHEIVYKRRNGKIPKGDASRSEFDDGHIGIRKMPIRGQDTVLKWFLGVNGEILGLTQQPWSGIIIDIPIEKMLLFRPSQHKNNPEGRSVLRNAYISYYYVKRMQEQEAVILERFGGLPVLKVPNQLLEGVAAGDTNALAQYAAYQKIVRNVRIDEQMGLILPSDHFATATGTGLPQYEFSLVTPAGGRAALNSDTPISRHKLDIATSLLADFLSMGHQARGAQNLGETKLDMFMQAVEGWLNSIAAILNRYLLPRIWVLNGFDLNLMPQYVPDTAQRLDLDVLSNFLLKLAQAGMPLFPDPDLENFIRDAAGLPDVSDKGAAQEVLTGAAAPENIDEGNPTPSSIAATTPGVAPVNDPAAAQQRGQQNNTNSKLQKILRASIARRARHLGLVRSA